MTQRRYKRRTKLLLSPSARQKVSFYLPFPLGSQDPPVPSPKWVFGCPSPTWTHLAPLQERYHVPEHHNIPVIFQLCRRPLAQSQSTSSSAFGKLRKHHLRTQKRNAPGWKPRSWPTNTKETPHQLPGLDSPQSAGFRQHHLAHPLAAGGKD